MPDVAAVVGAESDALLSYSTSTTPSPLQASPASGDPAIGEIDIVVSNNSDAPIYCEQITFTLPVGEDAKDLVKAGTEGDIHLAATPSEQWMIVAGGEPGEFIATPCKPEYAKLTEQGLLFQIYNIKVNQQVGTFELAVVEATSTTGRDYKPRRNTYLLAKFPYGFSFSDLKPSAPVVSDGEAVTLTWNGSENATYLLFPGANPPVDVTKVRTWTAPKPPGLHNDTTFVLEASVVIDNEVVHHYLTTTVMVSNPDLLASSLRVTGGSTLEGAVAAGSSLNVTGAATLGSATVSGALGAASAGISGAASVGGQLNVSGLLNALGPVAMHTLGVAANVSPGTYTAQSDGFLLGQVSAAGMDSGKKICGWIDAWYGSVYMCATGGNVVVWVDIGTFSSHWWHGNNSNSLVMPVPKGTTYTCRWTPANLDENPRYGFYWVSLGAGQGAAEPVRVGEVDMFPMPSPAVQVKTVENPFARS